MRISAFLAFQIHMFSQAKFRQWKFHKKCSMQNDLGKRGYENFTKMTHFNNAATTASKVAETCFKPNSHLLICLPFSPIPQIKLKKAFFPKKNCQVLNS